MNTKLASIALLLGATFLPPQETQVLTEDLEARRLELTRAWGGDGLIKPADVDIRAEELLGRPLEEQSDAELTLLAKHANTAANLVGFILEEYEEYHRENYRYDFVQEKIAPFHDAYVRVANRMKGYRNQAYFNLGVRATQRGDDVSAFFYFRDSYRLSVFVDEPGEKGMRYAAEIEMKKLLGLQDMETFIHWSDKRR